MKRKPFFFMPFGRFDAEMVLVTFLAAATAMMVVPLPAGFLDAAISANVCVSLLVLISSMRAAGPAGFGSFPTLLLLTTLMRLSLNVSSTRLILAEGEGGRVIEAFGRFAAGGNYVVGGIVFVVITVIQFIVIAKGAERVAEVAARFNLDAMPGKQMSIDAELRAGAIDQAEAQRRRAAIESESRFFGAMDGAMKFVKGDAIAGIVIAAVNVAGGVAMGVLFRGMAADEALAAYAVLSIGDGLVSQIPSLLISIAAGMLVTRTDAGAENTGIGASLQKALLSNPGTLFSVSAILGLLAVAPGLPAAPFAFLAAATFAGGLAARRKRDARKETKSSGGDTRPEPAAIRMPHPLVLESGLGTGGGPNEGTLARALDLAREQIRETYGLKVPAGRVVAKPTEDGNLTLRLHGAPIASAVFDGRTDAGKFASQFIEAALTSHLPELMGIQEAHDMVEELQVFYPALVKEAVPRILPYARLAELLKKLLEERVPLCDLKPILEAAAAVGPVENTAILVEAARQALRRQICARIRGAGVSLPVMLVDRSVEGAILDSVAEAGGRQCLTIHPKDARAIIEKIRDEVKSAGALGVFPALVTEAACRPFLRKIIESEMPDLHVLAYHELAPELKVEAVGKVALAA
ncbi:MAG: FHIPEP family type III secretion protein [Deltaproteobacteria bacterium]|nr:FHIPEP family type III secretion protein [Deltaproteobacteria bacterium]